MLRIVFSIYRTGNTAFVVLGREHKVMSSGAQVTCSPGLFLVDVTSQDMMRVEAMGTNNL